MTECEAIKEWIEEIEEFAHEKIKKIKDQGRNKDVIKVIGKIDKELKSKEIQRKKKTKKKKERRKCLMGQTRESLPGIKDF